MIEHDDILNGNSEDSEDTIELATDFAESDVTAEEVTPSADAGDDSDSEATPDGLPSDHVNDYVYAHYHRHKGKHHRKHRSRFHGYSDTDNETETVVRSHTEPHHKIRAKKARQAKWHDRPWWKKLLTILGFLLLGLIALLLTLVIAVFALRGIGLLKLTDYTDVEITAPEIESSVLVTDNGRSVNYKGKEYKLNENMTSILCIGVDKEELGLNDNAVGTGGQGDALYMAALDTATGKTTIIAIPRDIVTDIGVYSSTGEYLRTEKHQLCLAYAYGDGRKTSCLNTVTAVSRLMYQLPINSYYAININAVKDLNDAVGGVTVTLKDDTFYDQYGVRHYAGETLTLYGEDAARFVRQREVRYLESTTQRMSHQIDYLNSFSKTAIEMTKSDLTTPVKLYDIIADNSVTNLSTSTITAFATSIVQSGISELDFRTVPGELVSGGTYAEYNVDEQALYELILEIYYTPVQ